MIVARIILGIFVSAALGFAAMFLSPPMTFTYQLWGAEKVDYTWLSGVGSLCALLALAGLLSRLVTRSSPWLAGPSTGVILAAWAILSVSGGEDVAAYRAAWPGLMGVVIVSAVPGTVGACVAELIVRWRHRDQYIT